MGTVHNYGEYSLTNECRAAPILVFIGIGPISAFLVASESVKYVAQVPILLLYTTVKMKCAYHTKWCDK